MAALLIGLNTGAFACDSCAQGAVKKTVAKTSAKSTKVVANAKIAPKSAKKSGVKTVAVAAKSTKAAAPMCPHCQAEKAGVKS